MKTGYPIIDADGHVLEKDTELHDFLEGRYRGMPRMETYGYFPSLDGWHAGAAMPAVQRSEERRVGKECRSRWSPYH